MWNLHENSQLKQQVQAFFQKRADLVLGPWVAILDQGVAQGDLRPLDTRLCALSLLSMINVLVLYETRIVGAKLEVDPVEHTLDLFVNGVMSLQSRERERPV